MKKTLIAITGDKGGVGKSTITALFAEWLIYQNMSVHVIDADPNQSIKTWLDKCQEAGRRISDPEGIVTLVDTAGTSGAKGILTGASVIYSQYAFQYERATVRG